MQPSYLMQMHVYSETCNFTEGPMAATDITCNVPNPYDKEKGSKLWFTNNGIRLGQLTIKRLIKVPTLINITKVALLN